MDKTLRRVTDLQEQQDENYRYWQSQSVGDRLIAVCELSQAAYEFAAAFKKGSAAQHVQEQEIKEISCPDISIAPDH